MRPVRDLYRPYLPSTKHNIKVTETRIPLYDGASTIHDNHLPYNKHIHKRQLLFIVAGYAFLFNHILLLNFLEFGC